MKKISKIIFGLLLVSSFSGCNKVEGRNGTEAAKILLANERLNGEDLRKDGNIFTKGKQAFDRVVKETSKHRKAEPNIKKAFSKDNNIYKWSDAPDYSNFISFFDSYAVNIEHSATRGSNLIDSTKKNIRIVNKWVDVGDEEILLIVEENRETIFSRDDEQYEICRRYQNELGLNVFEMLISNSSSNYTSRMTYIPGLRYEYSAIHGDEDLLILIADKDKGYWDIMTTLTRFDDGFNEFTFTNLVMKDEAIYETSYTLREKDEYFGGVEIVTEDGKSDVLDYREESINLYTTGLTGLDCFYIQANDDEVYNLSQNNYEYPPNVDDYKVYSVGEGAEIQYFTQHGAPLNVRFTNGKEFKVGDSFYDGAITITDVMVSPTGGVDFYGIIGLRFNNNDFDFMFDNLKKLSDEYGFSLKGGFEENVKAAKYAKEDSINFSKYYKWQGLNINSLENNRRAVEIEKELIQDFVDLYEKNKNLDVIRQGQQGKLDSSYYFVDLSYSSKGTISNDGVKVNVNDLKVSVNDTTLFVVNEAYKVEIAVANYENGSYTNIFPLTTNNTESKVYNNETIFELNQTVEVNIPLLEEGTYTLVAYIATVEEGIRVTNPIAIEGSINESDISKEGLYNKIYNDGNEIKIDSSKDVTINISLSGTYTYDTLYAELESYAYNLGTTTEGKIEKLIDNSWIVIDSNETIGNGTYRLKYLNNNQEAYVVAVID